MIMQEEVNDIDRVVILADLSRRDMIYIDSVLSGGNRSEFGIIKEVGEDRLVVETWSEVVTFNSTSEPSLAAVLANIRRVPNFDKIETGIILSRVLGYANGKFFREYAKAVHVYRNSGVFNTLTVEFINGPLVGKRHTYSPNPGKPTLTAQMAGWEIED